MASNKKKQDEKHLKILREMVALPHNKQCFDCHQRGPTYINMTIGAFVCTACSGLLRGLNPPHRVKSISMASFTPEEMDFIKCHGNEFCRKVWLGLCDNRFSSQAESREETKVKDFMVQKYERKQFYVAPTDIMKEEAKRMNESAISKTPGTKPLKSLLGEGAPRLQVNTQKPASATPPPISSNPQSPGNQSLQSSKSSGSTAMDLLGDLGGDPFASTTPQSQPPAGGGFADFGNFGTTVSSGPSPFAQSTPLQPAGTQVSVAPQNTFNGFGISSSTAPTSTTSSGGGDKYSNLSDLFSTSSSETDTSSTGWSSTLGSNNTGGLNWNTTSTASSGGGINWGGESTSSSGGINWNSSSTQPVSSGGLNWGGGSMAQPSISASSSSWGAPATAQSNVANPFGGGNTSLSSQSTMPASQGAPNPFGGQPAQGGFGAFGAPPTSTMAQPGGFGQAPAVSAGSGFGMYGNHGNQNGAFGAQTSVGGFGGAPTSTAPGFGQGFGAQQPAFGQAGSFGQVPGSGFGGQQQMQGFGGAQPGFGAQPGWGQMPASTATVNPFMNTAQQYSAPKTGATNPFL